MFTQKITNETFLIIAMHHYDNSQCTTIAEFEEDIRRFNYLKKLFVRYRETGELKERLIINHIIILYNLFGVATVELLFFKIDKQYWDILVTFLDYLERMPEEVPEFNIKKSQFDLDPYILSALRNI